jgi:GTPase Era involved in 16S rRNA processing
MIEKTLREQADELFQAAISSTKNHTTLSLLHQELQHSHQKLDQPMRVAIVGKIKAGKSTLMNALLGEAVVATGTIEATFNINWLQYGEQPALRVHFKDDRPPEHKSFAELEAITVRSQDPASRAYLLSIQYIEVVYPNPILNTFNLIDTPGLDSFYKEDSQNTCDFLHLHGKQLTEATQAEASKADAVLYLFSQSIHESDRAIAEQFQGASLSRTTPINSIGVLTKVDAYWSDESPDPIEAGRRVAERLASHPQMRNLFYTIVPVCGLAALGIQTLKASEFDTLTQLAALPEERLDKLLRTVERFKTKEYPDQPEIPHLVQRQQVMQRLGQYGVWQACRLIRSGIVDQSLVLALMQNTGMKDLRHLITSHFGNRAFLIKLNTAVEHLLAICFQLQQQHTGSTLQTIQLIAGQLERLKAQAHEFQELRVLRSYYDGNLELADDEIQQLLQVTGEYGTSCANRLGLRDRATLDEMIAIAQQQVNQWRSRSNDAIGATYQTIAAARLVAHSYERILHHVSLAKRHLDY